MFPPRLVPATQHRLCSRPVTDAPQSPSSLPGLMGAHMRRRGETLDCWVDGHPHLCSNGILRASVLVMMIDVGAGWVADNNAGDDWTFTVDIGLRRALVETNRLEGEPVVQRAGRTISIDMPMTDEAGRRTATGVATFVRLPRRAGDPPRPAYPQKMTDDWPPPEAPLEELLAPRTVNGTLSVDLRPGLLNPAGILQGGVASLLAEIAAQRTLESSLGKPLAATSFDVRYVTMGRVGPIEAIVEPIGPTGAVVKLIDRGADDAVVTHNLIGFDRVD